LGTRGPLASGEGGSLEPFRSCDRAQVDSVLPADGRRPARLPDDATQPAIWQSKLFTKLE